MTDGDVDIITTGLPQALSPHDYATQKSFATARKSDVAKLLGIVEGLDKGTRSLGEGSDTLRLWRAVQARERTRCEVERRVANGVSYETALRQLKDEALLEEGIHAHPNPGP